MRRIRNAKIIATLGPGTSSEEMIKALFEAGADVFRLNFSHGDHADHKRRYDIIRALEEKYNRSIGILLDLQGPKLRVGRFDGGKVKLEQGSTFRLDLNDVIGDENRVSLHHPEIFQALEPGTDLLLDDGNIRLRVVECGSD
ncbi:MAG: pyruvate kinase, partial [Alphaproteobacteria bacterium]|nr:pyruvate kinase [Alphaproteobacteria bacterium]